MGEGPLNYDWHNPSPYIPGMVAMPNNPELGQLMGLFAGQVLGPMFGPQNFVPHLAAGGIGPMDQYAMRHFQQQQLISANAIGSANNADVANRLLALRTIFSKDPATEQNRNQATFAAGILNNPFVKGIAGQIVGPETLEAAMHGTRGDVSQLHSSTMRAGFFMRDPSGARRMDAQSMEDFSRGVYAHIYEEGGDFNRLEQEAATAKDENVRKESRRRLKKAARVRDDVDILTEADFIGRVNPEDLATKDRIDQAYKKYVQGKETDTIKQAEAIAKIQPAVQETGLLNDKEMLLPHLRRAAEKMQVAGMHGLMAGQVGQLQEYMLQRGMLPQALGSMTAADRVKLMGGELDQDTLRRLATTAAERELMTKESYRSMSPQEQKTQLDAETNKQIATLTETSKAIKQYNDGAPDKKSIADLEKMGGFETIAGNVDAQRTASALKKYSGAVDAVREIFGDNGNPNAPMPALLAALDHLTHGANFQMDAKEVETSLRQMQMTAREAGIGFEQMAGMAAQMGAMGQMMGVAPTTVMHNQVNAMAMIKTMRDTGTFANPRFGAMGQGEALQLVSQKMIAGDASDNARAMAAAASIYKAGKGTFAADSEFALAMEAYLGGKDTYKTAAGETKNLFELVGRQGPAAIAKMFTDAGGSQAELMAAFRSPIAMEFMRAGAGMQTMKYEAVRDINNFAVGGTTTARIRDFAQKNAGSALSGQNAENIGNIAGNKLTGMLVDTASMKTDEQFAFIQRELPQQLKQSFKEQLGVDDATADKLAQEAVQATIGTGDEQKRKLLEFRSQADMIIHGMSGGQLDIVKLSQMFRGDTVGQSLQAAQADRRVAARRAEVGQGFKSHPFARLSDYLLDAGMTGEKLNISRAMSEFLNIVPNKELAGRYIEGMQGGLTAANERLSAITYTDKRLNELAGANTAAADKELLELAKDAGMDPSKISLESSDAYNKRGETAANRLLATGDKEQITQAYLKASGNTSTTHSVDKMREYLTGNSETAKKFRAQQAEQAFLREHAGKKLKDMSDTDVDLAYAQQFGKDSAELTVDQKRQELLASDYGLREGAKAAKESGVMTRQQLAQELAQSDKVVGRLRKDAEAGGATEEEVKFLNRFNVAAFGAADEGTRKTILNEFISAYGMSATDADVTANESLDALIRNTDPNDADAKQKLADQVKAMMTAGDKPADDKTIARAQEMAETLRVGAAIDPKSAGITGVGDINTKDATINATGGTIVIQGAEVKGAADANAAQVNKPASEAIPDAATETTTKQPGTNKAAAAAAAQQAEQAGAAAQQKTTGTQTAAAQMGSEKTINVKLEGGQLSIVGLEKAVLEVMNKNRGPMQTAGDMPVST